MQHEASRSHHGSSSSQIVNPSRPGPLVKSTRGVKYRSGTTVCSTQTERVMPAPAALIGSAGSGRVTSLAFVPSKTSSPHAAPGAAGGAHADDEEGAACAA
eukprot:scaffold104115_cov67-Phaeocystis_antarctica.AAC.3